MRTVALFAASGRLPLILADELRRSGNAVLVVAVAPSVDERIKQMADSYVKASPGELQRAIDICREHSATAVVFAGKLEKSVFCAGMDFDDRFLRVLSSVEHLGDDQLMSAVAGEFESDGLEVVSQMELGRRMLAEEGPMTAKSPSSEQMEDVAFGLDALKTIGPLDVGQSVVVKRRVIVAVEGVEGTDRAVLRGGTLAGGGAVVVKAPKPGQDLRFDVPTVGQDTIVCMHVSGCSILAVKAGSTFVVDKHETVQLADRHGLCMVGV